MENIDFKKLSNTLNPDQKKISYAENKHLFVKVGFDVFKFTGAPVESYWTLEKDDDGAEYLVANYEKTSDQDIVAESNWEVLSDKKAENITLMYSNVPIKRLASSEYSFTPDDIHVFKKALIEKLSSDDKFVKSLMNTLSGKKREALQETFPELTKSEDQV